ncbi:hypothetical protein SVIO_052400 [Streptomyces violaceusniger]|uniref:AMP-dependent synthetase/ligase domain-containing protein n=1 Tax=Streptomyces violaceusniger TaxID=68280 RepID=A0A4D4L7J5_STRVO|nr:hypothetical protein SVIO_052400 [Streptomyces violaceusniger]
MLLRYADARADLVLVARRSACGEHELRELAAYLLEGTGPRPRIAEAVGQWAATETVGQLPATGTRPEAEWGLGAPARSGQVGAVPVELRACVISPAGRAASGTHARGVAETPTWLRHEGAPAPCDRTHQTPHADPTGDMTQALKEPQPSQATLHAAVALVLARYSAGESTAVAELGADAAPGDALVRSVPCDERLTAAAYVALWHPDSGETAGAPGPVPEVGVVFSEARQGVDYRPFLAPALPVVVHWRRGADGTVDGVLTYDEGEVAPEIARNLAAHIGHVADQLTAYPDRPLTEIDLMPRTEALALVECGATPALSDPATLNRTVHGLFEETVRRQPDAVAVVDGDNRLTYAQLDQRADRLARGLRALGTASGDLVGVALDRTADLIVTLLGVLKAGGVYVPMDIRYPEERLRYTAEQAGLRIVVGSADSFPEIENVRVLDPGELAELGEPGERGAEEPPSGAVDGSSPAYVIFTSGSTGRPKGS